MTPGQGSAGQGPADAERWAQLARELRDFAGSEGAPEATQTLADLLPGMTSGSALYAFGASLSLVLGDAASALEAAAALATEASDTEASDTASSGTQSPTSEPPTTEPLGERG